MELQLTPIVLRANGLLPQSARCICQINFYMQNKRDGVLGSVKASSAVSSARDGIPERYRIERHSDKLRRSATTGYTAGLPLQILSP
jgi:hypothetical protein